MMSQHSLWQISDMETATKPLQMGQILFYFHASDGVAFA